MSDTFLLWVVAILVFLYGAARIVEYNNGTVVRATPKHEFNPDPVNPSMHRQRCNAVITKSDGTYVLIHNKPCQII